jgi:hypothetical protein
VTIAEVFLKDSPSMLKQAIEGEQPEEIERVLAILKQTPSVDAYDIFMSAFIYGTLDNVQLPVPQTSYYKYRVLTNAGTDPEDFETVTIDLFALLDAIQLAKNLTAPCVKYLLAPTLHNEFEDVLFDEKGILALCNSTQAAPDSEDAQHHDFIGQKDVAEFLLYWTFKFASNKARSETVIREHDGMVMKQLHQKSYRQFNRAAVQNGKIDVSKDSIAMSIKQKVLNWLSEWEKTSGQVLKKKVKNTTSSAKNSTEAIPEQATASQESIPGDAPAAADPHVAESNTDAGIAASSTAEAGPPDPQVANSKPSNKRKKTRTRATRADPAREEPSTRRLKTAAEDSTTNTADANEDQLEAAGPQTTPIINLEAYRANIEAQSAVWGHFDPLRQLMFDHNGVHPGMLTLDQRQLALRILLNDLQ